MEFKESSQEESDSELVVALINMGKKKEIMNSLIERAEIILEIMGEVEDTKEEEKKNQSKKAAKNKGGVNIAASCAFIRKCLESAREFFITQLKSIPEYDAKSGNFTFHYLDSEYYRLKIK